MYIHIYIYRYLCILPFQTENGEPKPKPFFFNLFTVCSPYKWKQNKETNGSYLFANGLN